MKKRILSILTALVLCLTLLPTAALAGEPDYTSLSGEDSFQEWNSTGDTPTVPYKAPALSGVQGEYDYYLPEGHYMLTAPISGISIKIIGKVTLDLNGYTLTGPSNKPALVVGYDDDSSGNLTLKDSSANGTGKVTNNYHAINVGNGSLTLESGTVSCTSSNDSFAICVDEGTTVTLKGGTVSATAGSKAISLSHLDNAKKAPILNADGGTVEGLVINSKGIITRSSNSVTTATTFNGNVKNYGTGGKIEWGTFNGDVENGYGSGPEYFSGTISGGTFNGTVTNLAHSDRSSGKYGTLDNSNKTITNNGKFVFQSGYKNGETEITAANASEFINGLNLSGTGYVDIQSGSGSDTTHSYYSHSGTSITDPNTKAVVTFDLNGGTGTIPPQGIYDGGKAAKPTNPTRDGYTFGDWYEKENGAFKATAFDFDTAITADTTLYAKWTHVAHTGGEATCQARAVCATCGEPYGELGSHKYTTENKDAEGALKTAGNCQNEAVYYKSCSVCGAVSTSDTDTFKGDKDPNNHTGMLGEWQKDADGHWKIYSCCPIVKVNEGAHSYTSGLCECGAVQYTVTFDPNGGTVDPASATTDIDGKLTELPTPTRSGSYRFDGWFTEQNGGTAVTVDTVFTAHTTVYAHWTFIPVYIPVPTYAVAVSDTYNGTVTVSHRYAERGDTVTITVAPDEGYTLDTLTVLDKNGKEIELTDKGDGKYTFKMPGGKVEVKATFAEDNSMLNFFVDVTADQYYYDAVLWAAKNGITGGVDENHFGPDLSCTRAQLVTFLWRAAGCPVVNYAMNFSDVGDDYYTEAVRWAASLGIVGGYGNGLFGSNDTITREQMATILYRFAQTQGNGFSGAWAFRLNFEDVSELSDWAVEGVSWCVMNDIMQGYDNNLMPKAECTRAQIVTMLYRLLGE